MSLGQANGREDTAILGGVGALDLQSPGSDCAPGGFTVARVASELTIPVLGSGDCVEPEEILRRMALGVSGVLVGRGVLRNPWILAQASALSAGRSVRPVTLGERRAFLVDYIDLLVEERVNETAGFRHVAPTAEIHDAALSPRPPSVQARGRERRADLVFAET